jgi:2,4-dichlorophenol 6-monooxygenase
VYRQGRRLSTHDLLRPGEFLLLTGADDRDWSRAADAVAERFDVVIGRARIDGARAELTDQDGTWRELRGHDDAGALLVRPDGHIAFRAPSGVADHEHAIAAAIGQTLGVAGARVPNPV